MALNKARKRRDCATWRAASVTDPFACFWPAAFHLQMRSIRRYLFASSLFATDAPWSSWLLTKCDTARVHIDSHIVLVSSGWHMGNTREP